MENVFLESVSGGLDLSERPALQALLHYLDAMKKTGNRYVVIFDDHKRFARHTEMHLRLKTEIAKRGAKVEYLNFTVDETPEGAFIETMLAAQAQLEREQNGRQTKQKTKARLEKGFWTFRAPIGYKYVKSQHGGKELVPDEPYFSTIKEALEGFALGRFASQAEVKRFLEADPHFPKDLPNGTLRNQTVARIMEQIIYAGYLEAASHNVSLRKAQHQGVITLETYEKIQKKRKEKAYLPVRKDVHRDFVLRGAIRCHCCKTPLRSAWTKGRSDYYPYYVCYHKDCDYYGKSIKRDVLESEFADLLKTMQPSESVFNMVREMYRDAWESQAESVKQNAVSFKREAESADKEIKKIVKRIMEANSPHVIAAYEERIEELEKHKLVCMEKSANLAVPKDPFNKKVEPLLIFLANPYKLWVSGAFEVKRIILKLVFPEPLYYDRAEGQRQLKPDVRTAKTPLKAPKTLAFMPFAGDVVQDGAD